MVVGWGVGAAAAAAHGLPSEPFSGLGGVAATWISAQFGRLFPHRQAEAMASDELLAQIDPRTKVRGLWAVATGRMRRLAALTSISGADYDDMDTAVSRAIDSARRCLVLNRDVNDEMNRIVDAYIDLGNDWTPQRLHEIEAVWTAFGELLSTMAPVEADT